MILGDCMDSKKLGVKLKMLRKEKAKLTLQEVADWLNVNKSSVSRWEKGEITKISKSTLSSLATLYGVTLEFLIGEETEETLNKEDFTPYEKNNAIPVLGTIAAGLPLYAEQNIEEYTEYNKNDGNEYFALNVKGDSMNAARIEEGDLLIIRRQDYIENGAIAAVMIDDEEATVKKFYQNQDTVMLIPMSKNPKHQIQVYNLKETKIKILGKLVENKIKF